MGSPEVVSFDNTQNAFAYKTDKELKKAAFLFASMGYSWLVKIGTGLTPKAIKAGLPIKSLIRNTIFTQFVGGETLEETTQVAKKLGAFNVSVILDYGVEGGEEGEEGFDHAMEEFIRVIDYAATQPNIPFMSIKVTGFSRFGLLEKLDSSVAGNTGSLMKRYESGRGAFSGGKRMGKGAGSDGYDMQTRYGKNVGVLVDAEETWIQDPVDVLTILMMERYNTVTPVVYNTVQLYRHDRLSFLKDSLEAAELRSFILGTKLVRGAYMGEGKNKGRRYAVPFAYPADKAATDRDYDAGVSFCIEHLDKIATIVASHNEQSNLLAIRLLREKVSRFIILIFISLNYMV